MYTSMLSLRGKEGFGHGVGILTFSIKKIQIPHPPEQNNRSKSLKMVKSRESLKPIIKRTNRNHLITFDSHLKTALVTIMIVVDKSYS